MTDDPLDPRHHRRDPAAPRSAEHSHVDDVRLRRDADELSAGAGAIAGDDPGDVGPVTSRIARRARVREVDRCEDPIGRLRQIGIRRDS